MSSSITRKLLHIATSGARQLSADARKRLYGFISSRQNANGAFRGRGSDSDLYYTWFGLAVMLTLETELSDNKELPAYLASFGNGRQLDFIHRVSLVRVWTLWSYMNSCKAGKIPTQRFCTPPITDNEDLHRFPSRLVSVNLEEYRSLDGGYHHKHKKAACGTAYGAFTALTAYQDMGIRIPESNALTDSIARIKLSDASFANDENATTGTTTATAAALGLLREMNHPLPPESLKCLIKRADPAGGFRAIANAPVPDLLSTAVALYTLAQAEYPLPRSLKTRTVAFIESLWNEDGGFAGNMFDRDSDCEYTFYALLALGISSDTEL